MKKDEHNIQKFQYQQIKIFKQLRIKKFEQLDIDFFKALENNDKSEIEKIKIKKNQLRDLPNYKFPDFEDPREILDHYPNYLL